MRGFPVGASAKGGQAAAVTNTQLARDFYAVLSPLVLELQREGLSLRGIARELERRGVRTRQEFGKWHPNAVRRALARAAVPVARPPMPTADA